MKKKLLFADSLRGFAILGVILTHCGSTIFVDGLPSWLKNLSDQGSMGVQLFFIVSAFTLFYSLNNRIKKESFQLSEFFIRRFFRIAPLYYLAMCFYTLKNFTLYKININPTFDLDIGKVISTLTFTNTINPYWLHGYVPGGWSISDEMMFYLLVPILFYMIKNLKHAILLFISTVSIGYFANAIFVNTIGSNIENLNEFIFHWFPNQLAIFTFGILFYHLFKSENNIIQKNFNNYHYHIMAFLFIMMLLTLGLFTTGDMLFNHILFGIAFVGFSYSIGKGKLKLFVNKYTAFIGEISFSMYLIHFFVLDVVATVVKHLLPGLTGIPKFSVLLFATFTISAILSTFTYFLIEKQFIKLGGKIISNRRAAKGTLQADIQGS
jgi:peptidoglycan/LPS O-acetylase OafA/YrhL